jgi:hypothetical protein
MPPLIKATTSGVPDPGVQISSNVALIMCFFLQAQFDTGMAISSHPSV